MSNADTCRPVVVDGEVIRVHGGGEMDDTDREFFAEIVHAAKRRFEAEDTLPGMPDLPPQVEVPAGLSADQRRTQRQRQQIDAGTHPLMGGPLHSLAAPEVCSPDAPRGAPFTCGSCRFRELVSWHRKTYPKCVRDLARVDQDGGDLAARTPDTAANISHGAATDCRGWWPGCRHYEAGDQGLSPDASRVIP